MTYNSYQVGSEDNQTFSSASAEPPRTNTSISIKVNEDFKGTTRVDPNTGVTQEGVASVIAGQGATVRSASGQPRAFASRADDVMEHGGLQTSAKVLESLGIVTLNAQGRYEFTEASKQENSPQEAPASTDPHETFHMSEDQNQEINNLIPQGVEPSQIHAVSAHAIAGNLEAAAKSLAQSSGQTPAQATDTVNAVAAKYTQAATKYLGDVVKLPSDHIQPFYDYIQAKHPSETKSAISAMVNQNNFKALGKLVGKYAQAFPPSAAQLNEVGIKTRSADKTTDTIKIRGMEMSIKAARRAGLI